jgi:hypothetical protein
MFCKQSFTLFVFCIMSLSVYSLGQSKISSKNLKIKNFATNLNLIQLENNSTAFDFAYLEKCNLETCLQQFGTCLDTIVCKCHPEYANFNVTTACSYERKKASIAAIVEILCPIGSAYFYLGYERLGLLKTFVIIFLPGLIMFHIYFCCGSLINDKNYILITVYKILLYTYLALFAFWLVYDLIQIGSNKILDSNGVKLVQLID